jgi:hypothetical protein
LDLFSDPRVSERDVAAMNANSTVGQIAEAARRAGRYFIGNISTPPQQYRSNTVAITTHLVSIIYA